MSATNLSPDAELDQVAFRILGLAQAGQQLATDANGEAESDAIVSIFDTIAELSMPLACRLFDQRRAQA